VLVPELLRWPYRDRDPELRKAFEVALHAGTAAALLIALRVEVREALSELDARRLLRHAAELAPPATAVLVLERPIEERLGSPRGVALAQIAAGAALALADRRPAERGHEEAGIQDSLLLGAGQAAALVPGISRNGATLTVARLRRFRRASANRLSRHAALPVIVAAAGLKGYRLARRGMPAGEALAFAAGGLAAFASTLALSGLVPRVDRARSYLPFAAYRVALGGIALVRLNGGDGR
jgi:undecaprenyl-diphosphatase